MNIDLDQTATRRLWTSGPYETENDLQKMQDMLVEARSLTDDWRYWHIGELIFDFFMVTCHLNPEKHILLWSDNLGKLVGYAILGEDPSFDFQVMPKFEWCGIEAEALTWAEMHLAELRRHDVRKWSGKLVASARQDNQQRIAFLEQHGFRYRGKFDELNFLRLLDEPIPEPILPTGFQIRTLAEEGEVSNRAAAQREVWQPWTVGDVSDDDYARLMRLPGYQRDLDVVTITPDGIIAAYVNGWIDPINMIGDFGPVGALPAYRRQGLTRAALLEGLRRMKALGMNRVCVSTGVSNEPALRLYESIGFKVMNKRIEYIKTD